MPLEHTVPMDETKEFLEASREKNLSTPHVPNRTKVVRLIVVSPHVNPTKKEQVLPLAKEHGAARADTFIVKKGDMWVPMSWLGEALVPHDDAVHAHREATVILMVQDREQLQWESTVPFVVTDIRQHAPIPEQHLVNWGGGPSPDPFDGRVKGARGGPGRPVRSGPPSLNGNRPYNQLYKVSFLMEIDDKQVDIDPDVYCDWG